MEVNRAKANDNKQHPNYIDARFYLNSVLTEQGDEDRWDDEEQKIASLQQKDAFHESKHSQMLCI